MTVVVGFDASPAARAALTAVLEVVGRDGEALVIVHAVEPPGAVSGEEYRAHAAALEEVGRALADEAVGIAREAGVEAEVALVRERPARALIRVADEHDARVIAVGTHSESPLRGAIVGSTPHKLLHLSTRPVLVVPAPPGG
jgi:nucleotide-binding universal stress UspA family protein